MNYINTKKINKENYLLVEIEVEEIDIPQGILNSENFLNKAIYIYKEYTLEPKKEKFKT